MGDELYKDGYYTGVINERMLILNWLRENGLADVAERLREQEHLPVGEGAVTGHDLSVSF